MAPSLRKLHLVLTGRCNLRCAYCYQNRRSRGRMRWETLCEGLALAAASPAKELHLVFSGGEPLLEMPLIRRAVRLARTLRPEPGALRLAVITNGTLLRPETASYLVDQGFEVLLSFDGSPAAQDLRGRGTFAILDRRLEELRRDHPAFLRRGLTVAVTLTPRTIGGLAGAIRYLNWKGVRRITVYPVIGPAPGWSEARHRLLLAQFEKIVELSVGLHGAGGQIPFLALRAPEHRPPPRRSPVTRAPGRPQGSRRSDALCGAGHGEALTLGPDGEIAPCALWLESLQEHPEMLRSRLEPLGLGTVGSEGLLERMASLKDLVTQVDLFNRRERKRSAYGRCATCRYREDCAVCPVAIALAPGNRDPHRIPDFHCAYNRAVLAAREEFQRRVSRRASPRGGSGRVAAHGGAASRRVRSGP